MLAPIPGISPKKSRMPMCSKSPAGVHGQLVLEKPCRCAEVLCRSASCVVQDGCMLGLSLGNCPARSWMHSAASASCRCAWPAGPGLRCRRAEVLCRLVLKVSCRRVRARWAPVSCKCASKCAGSHCTLVHPHLRAISLAVVCQLRQHDDPWECVGNLESS